MNIFMKANLAVFAWKFPLIKDKFNANFTKSITINLLDLLLSDIGHDEYNLPATVIDIAPSAILRIFYRR